MDTSIYIMSIPELKKSIELKEKEYRDAIKARKVFWEVKRIMEQKRSLEKQLLQNLLKN
jgi:phage pi2 protein 07